MIRLPILTDRLELRRFSCADLKAFQAYRSDPALAEYQGWESTNDEQALAFLIEQSTQVFGIEHQWLQVAVVSSDAGALIGDVGLCVFDSKLGIAEIGFTISRRFQRRGYAAEAIQGILSQLFVESPIQRLIAVTDSRNAPTILLLQRLGFSLTETTDAVFRGAPCTEHTFEFTTADNQVVHRSPRSGVF